MKNNYSNLFENSSDFRNNMGWLFFETPCSFSSGKKKKKNAYSVKDSLSLFREVCPQQKLAILIEPVLILLKSTRNTK